MPSALSLIIEFAVALHHVEDMFQRSKQDSNQIILVFNTSCILFRPQRFPMNGKLEGQE
jgi:hypothetical protein